MSFTEPMSPAEREITAVDMLENVLEYVKAGISPDSGYYKLLEEFQEKTIEYRGVLWDNAHELLAEPEVADPVPTGENNSGSNQN